MIDRCVTLWRTICISQWRSEFWDTEVSTAGLPTCLSDCLMFSILLILNTSIWKSLNLFSGLMQQKSISHFHCHCYCSSYLCSVILFVFNLFSALNSRKVLAMPFFQVGITKVDTGQLSHTWTLCFC